MSHATTKNYYNKIKKWINTAQRSNLCRAEEVASKRCISSNLLKHYAANSFKQTYSCNVTLSDGETQVDINIRQ